MSAIFSPVLCRHTFGSATVDGITQGSRVAFINGSLGITVGDHLFVADDDYTNCEYLGKVTSMVAGTEVRFQFPAQSARMAGRLHTPSTWWQAASVPGTGGVMPTWESGIETLNTTGKDLLHTRTQEEREYVEIIVQDAMAADFQAYKNWIRSELDGGLYRFVAAYMDYEAGRSRCDVVKFREPGQAVRATEKAHKLRSWSVDLQVLQRDYFIPS